MNGSFATLELDLRPDVAVERGADGRTALRGRHRRVDLGMLAPGTAAAIDRLATTGATADALTSEAAADGPRGAATMAFCLDVLRRRGMVRHAVRTPSGLLARATPTTGGCLEPTGLDDDVPVQLSRFAFVHREDDRMVLESPTTPVVVELLLPAGAALVAALAQPRTTIELAGACPATSCRDAAALRELLVAAALAAPCADEHPALRQWEFHDLVFHGRSRLGLHDRPYGAVPLGPEAPAALPAVSPPRPGVSIPLHRPDLAAVARCDPSLTDVLERRRSVRVHGDAPITADQLGELLYRAARVRRVTPADADDPRTYEISDRPHPSGGAAHDLDIYLTVHACTGLAAGLYHYDPAAHVLEVVSGSTSATDRLLRDGVVAPPAVPQVLVTFASRFGRVARRYRSIAYALTMKHVGVLQQTCCLVATAMGLAACPLGGGDSDAFAAAAGTDPFAEAAVGELILGSIPAPTEAGG